MVDRHCTRGMLSRCTVQAPLRNPDFTCQVFPGSHWTLDVSSSTMYPVDVNSR